jgi:hypothetical protein
VRPSKVVWPTLKEVFGLKGPVGAGYFQADLVFWLPLGAVGVDVGGL